MNLFAAFFALLVLAAIIVGGVLLWNQRIERKQRAAFWNEIEEIPVVEDDEDDICRDCAEDYCVNCIIEDGIARVA